MAVEIKQGKLIRFQITPEVYGTGRICGLATMGAPVIGRSVIIEIVDGGQIDEKTYPYTHMVVFECQITGEVDEGQ